MSCKCSFKIHPNQNATISEQEFSFDHCACQFIGVGRTSPWSSHMRRNQNMLLVHLLTWIGHLSRCHNFEESGLIDSPTQTIDSSCCGIFFGPLAECCARGRARNLKLVCECPSSVHFVVPPSLLPRCAGVDCPAHLRRYRWGGTVYHANPGGSLFHWGHRSRTL